MANLPEGFYVDNLFCFPVGSKTPEGFQNFNYLPIAPKIEIVGGEIKASLLNSDMAAVLSLQLLWEADPVLIDKAKTIIGERYPNLINSSLEVADMSNLTATLKISDQGKELHNIGPKQTSGAKSYRVAFQDTLLKSEKKVVLKAFEGDSKILTITYQGTLKLNEVAEITVSTDLADELKGLAPREVVEKSFFGKRTSWTSMPGLYTCQESVEEAMKKGKLNLIENHSANISSEKKERIKQELLSFLAEKLYSKIGQLGNDAQYMSSFKINETKSKPEEVSFDLNITYDLVDTIIGSGRRSLIKTSDSNIPEPSR